MVLHSPDSEMTRSLVTAALLGTLLMAAQLALAVLPNIELVSFLIILYALVYQKRVFTIIYVFVFLEGALFGFGLWWVNYLYVWSVLAFVVLLLRKNQSVLVWAVVAGAFGMSFGALCALPYLIAGGPGAAFSYWVAGIPFDLLHAAGNFVLTLALFRPMHRLLERLTAPIKN